MAISPPAHRAPLSRRLAETQSSPVRELLELAMRPEVISLAGGLPAPDTFDVPGLAAAFAEVMNGPDAIRALQYSTTEGDPALRARLADYMGRRGLAVHADDILVTTGSQQALGLIATAMLDPGDTVLVEDPTYLAALQVFQLAEINAVGVACDEDGPLPDGLIEAAAKHGAKVAYLIPTFQNPTGRTMPAERRAAIAEAAVQPPGCGSSRTTRTARCAWRARTSTCWPRTRPTARSSSRRSPRCSRRACGSATCAPPQALRGPLVVAKQAADLHTSTVAQLAAERWLAAHDLGEHIAGLAAHYRPRRDALLAGLEEHLPPGSRCTHPEGGLFIWVELPEGHDAEAILARAIDAGIAFVPGKYFYAGEAPAQHAARQLRHGDARGADRGRQASGRRHRWSIVSSAAAARRSPSSAWARGRRWIPTESATSSSTPRWTPARPSSTPRRCTARPRACSRTASRAAATRRSSPTSCGRPTTRRRSRRPTARWSGTARSTSTRSTTSSAGAPGWTCSRSSRPTAACG